MRSSTPDPAVDAAVLAAAWIAAELGTAPPPGGALYPSTAARDWAASGAMALTEPPRLAPGAPASWMRAAAAFVGDGAVVPDPAALLGERVACVPDRPRPFRALRGPDGWFGLSLARPSDVDLVPALVEHEVAGDPWPAVAAWVAGRPVSAAEARVRLLGLPGGVIAAGGRAAGGRAAGGRAAGGQAADLGPAVRVAPGGPARGDGRRPLVVDLSALWAGPLCANLLGLAGARVVTVESTTRPDGARATPAFHALLHAGHESVVLDFADPAGRRALRELVNRADVVIEASRPRALRQLGLRASAAAAAGTVWVAISAYGRSHPDRVGFGDDVAAAAGLVLDGGAGPYPVGDAIADPLAGVTAAAAASVALRAGRGGVLDVSMRDVAAAAAALPAEDGEVVRGPDGWCVRLGADLVPVRPPRARAAP